MWITTNRKMLIMLLSCFLLFGGIFGFKVFGRIMMNRYFDNMPMPLATVTSTQVIEKPWETSLEAVGTFKAIHGTVLSSEVAGTVTQIHVQSGAEVNVGQPLVSLDAKVDRALLEEFEAASRLAQQEYDRYKQLYKKGSVSEFDLDRKKSEAEQSIAKVLSQKELVLKKTIHAPFVGRLGIRHVDLGEYVQPGKPLFNLQTITPIFLNFSLPEQFYDRVKKGYAVTAMLDFLPNEHFHGEITAIEPSIEESTRNFNIQATFDNAFRLLKPGMFANIKILLPETTQSLVIPRTAIRFNPYGNYVYVVETISNDDKNKAPQTYVKSRFIKTGKMEGELITVTQGLEIGEQVVTSGLLKLRNNIPVQINNQVKPSESSAPTVENS